MKEVFYHPHEFLNLKEIKTQALDWHKEFNQKNWQDKPSFHDNQHVEAVLTSSQKIIDAVKNENDPLKIKKDLKKWNEFHQSGLDLKNFKRALNLAIYWHDLGNIADDFDGKKPNFLSQYAAKNAEDRSQEISKKIMEQPRFSNSQKLVPLIGHLINETKFIKNQEVPFANLMRVIDQIGNDLFSENEQRVEGLLLENYVEDKKATFNPYFFFNFTKNRFQQLIPEEKTRRQILEIFEKKIPEEKNFENKTILIEDWLKNKKII